VTKIYKNTTRLAVFKKKTTIKSFPQKLKLMSENRHAPKVMSFSAKPASHMFGKNIKQKMISVHLKNIVQVFFSFFG